MRALSFFITLIIITSCSQLPQREREVLVSDGVTYQQMSVERLPDMNSPRGTHRTVIIGNEIVVLGGQTDGFKPLETSEYYSEGAWHTVPMMYPHITGFAALLPDGKILLGGGSAEAFGIGQSWGVEMYNPETHSFSAVGIMSEKRSLPSALTLPDSSVVIAGNWYADDSWEVWSAERGFVPKGPLTPGWSEPYILPASQDDIIVFGPIDNNGGETNGLVTHLGGDQEQVPLLLEWTPIVNYFIFPENLKIADYTYLFIAKNRSNEHAIVKVASGEFSLLEMETPLPSTGPDGNPIVWANLQVDRPARLVWVHGFAAKTGRIYFARIGYDATLDGGKASASFFYADKPGGFPAGVARLMSGGRMVLAGGLGWNKDSFPLQVDNFKTYPDVYVFSTQPEERESSPWLWIAVGIIVVVGCIFLAYRMMAKKSPEEAEKDIAEEAKKSKQELQEQISRLIEEKQLFRKKDIRISDIASELATNRTYISLIVNSYLGTSFSDLINGYRIEYAQKLMKEHPEMSHTEVAEESGFSSRTSFLRTFKAKTGLSPTEWKQQ